MVETKVHNTKQLSKQPLSLFDETDFYFDKTSLLHNILTFLKTPLTKPCDEWLDVIVNTGVELFLGRIWIVTGGLADILDKKGMRISRFNPLMSKHKGWFRGIIPEFTTSKEAKAY